MFCLGLCLSSETPSPIWWTHTIYLLFIDRSAQSSLSVERTCQRWPQCGAEAGTWLSGWRMSTASSFCHFSPEKNFRAWCAHFHSLPLSPQNPLLLPVASGGPGLEFLRFKVSTHVLLLRRGGSPKLLGIPAWSPISKVSTTSSTYTKPSWGRDINQLASLCYIPWDGKLSGKSWILCSYHLPTHFSSKLFMPTHNGYCTCSLVLVGFIPSYSLTVILVGNRIKHLCSTHHGYLEIWVESQKFTTLPKKYIPRPKGAI